MRIALKVEYNGAGFHGWQKQRDLRTVQETLETALSEVADSEVQLYCAGRTDTGVHATGQVVHFDTNASRSMRGWIYGTNAKLPKDVTVRWAKQVDENFHARFSALARQYRYYIYNNPIRSSIHQGLMTWHYRPLNHQRMEKAAQTFIGEHDFTSFRAIECQANSPMRHLTHFTVRRQGDIVVMEVKAKSFLHHMVRNLAGVLFEIGSGRQDISWAEQVLNARDRAMGGVTAPPYGLYLTRVDYDREFQIPNDDN